MVHAGEVTYIAHYREKDDVEQSVEEHLLSVAAKAKGFADKVGLASFGELMGLVHDLGKYSAEFQAYVKSAVGRINPDADEYVDAKGMKGKIDHSSAGAQYVWERLPHGGETDLRALLARQISALAIASHHAGLMDCLHPDGRDCFTERMGKSKRLTHFDEVLTKIDRSVAERLDILLASSTGQKELSAYDERSRSEDSQAVAAFEKGLLARFLLSTLLDADRLDTADFIDPDGAQFRQNGRYTRWERLARRVERHVAGFEVSGKVDQVRGEVSAHCLAFASRERGLYTLTVPTGGGKTLASLRFALHHAERHQMDRVIYVVPYTSIIDQNAKVARAVLEEASERGQVVLEHHSNLTPEQDTCQTKILSQNWDAPVVFTTAVQFLETLFASGTRGARRMHQLANAVIIFDEVQTLPPRVVHMFNNAVNFLVDRCESTVVFCTATQPLLHKTDGANGAARLSANSEMMPSVGTLFERLRRVEVVDARRVEGWTHAQVAEQAVRELEKSDSVLVVVNTKAAAKAVYEWCHSHTTARTFHLSTNMCAAHRLKTLEEVRTCLESEAPSPVICVSTQLIEAGVDIDFCTVIRFLAGLDSIAQAAGRCNRNGRYPCGKALIVNSAEEKLSHLRDISMAQEMAKRVLDEFAENPAAFDHDLIGPKMMERYFQYHFFGRAKEMAYPVGKESVGHNDSLLSLLSTNGVSVEAYGRGHGKKRPPFCLRQSFRSAADEFKAIDSPTEGILVPYEEEGKRLIACLCAADSRQEQLDLLRQAQRYSVNVFPYVFKQLLEHQCIHETQEGSGIMYLGENYYGDLGASVKQVAELACLTA